MAKAQFSKPASQLDLEARQKKDYVPPTQVQPAQDPTQSDNGYIAVDPIYQNHANDTEAPIQAEGGPEAKVLDQYYSDDVDFSATDAEDAREDQDSGPTSGGTTTASGASAGPPSGGQNPPPRQSS